MRRRPTGVSGNWWKNDTDWRTCLDLNKIAQYGRLDSTLARALPGAVPAEATTGAEPHSAWRGRIEVADGRERWERWSVSPIRSPPARPSHARRFQRPSVPCPSVPRDGKLVGAQGLLSRPKSSDRFSNPTSAPGSRQSVFQGGRIYWSQATVGQAATPPAPRHYPTTPRPPPHDRRR